MERFFNYTNYNANTGYYYSSYHSSVDKGYIFIQDQQGLTSSCVFPHICTILPYSTVKLIHDYDQSKRLTGIVSIGMLKDNKNTEYYRYKYKDADSDKENQCHYLNHQGRTQFISLNEPSNGGIVIEK